MFNRLAAESLLILSSYKRKKLTAVVDNIEQEQTQWENGDLHGCGSVA
jgi:hypothetical protein